MLLSTQIPGASWAVQQFESGAQSCWSPQLRRWLCCSADRNFSKEACSVNLMWVTGRDASSADAVDLKHFSPQRICILGNSSFLLKQGQNPDLFLRSQINSTLARQKPSLIIHSPSTPPPRSLWLSFLHLKRIY